jgi:RND family efflux transporter MFP subunit
MSHVDRTVSHLLRLARPALTASIAVLAFSACGAEAPPPPPPPAVTVAPVIQREITDWDEFTGRLEAVDIVEVRPRISGHIQRVAFTEGSEVRKGDVLFQIDPRPYAATLARAEAELEQARTRAALAASEVERAEKLVAVQAISREEFDTRTSGLAQAGASIKAAEAAVAAARLDLEWTKIRSPITGRVGKAEVTEGNLVQAGAPGGPLTTVVSVDSMRVAFETDEATYLRYVSRARSNGKHGSGKIPVRMALANDTAYPHRGHIDFVDNRLDPRTGTIRGRAVFSNAERLFTPGLFARIQVEGSEPYTATLIRDGAVGTDQDRKFVLVLKDDGTVDYRPVRLGRLAEGLRVVEDGLKPGEKIVVNGLQRARPGTKVSATVASMTSDSAVVAAR